MDNTHARELVLQHWGIKGQKWGVRRYQNKDGSLTDAGRKRYGDNPFSDDDGKPKKLTRKQRKEQARKEAEEAKAREEAETIEQKRERLLKSSDASELYKNKDLLSTAEINERLNRIDVERKLEKAMNDSIPPKEKFSDKFSDKVESALKVGRKINDVYEFATEKPVMKAVWKKLGLTKGEDEKSFDIKKIYENRDKMSDKDIQNAANRSENYNKLKKLYDDVNSASSKSADIKKLSESLSRKSEQIVNTSNSDAKKEVQDALAKVPKSDALKKAAAVEIAKEVGPELSEIISTFNEGIIKANQKRLDDAKKNN